MEKTYEIALTADELNILNVMLDTHSDRCNNIVLLARQKGLSSTDAFEKLSNLRRRIRDIIEINSL